MGKSSYKHFSPPDMNCPHHGSQWTQIMHVLTVSSSLERLQITSQVNNTDLSREVSKATEELKQHEDQERELVCTVEKLQNKIKKVNVKRFNEKLKRKEEQISDKLEMIRSKI